MTTFDDFELKEVYTHMGLRIHLIFNVKHYR